MTASVIHAFKCNVEHITVDAPVVSSTPMASERKVLLLDAPIADSVISLSQATSRSCFVHIIIAGLLLAVSCCMVTQPKPTPKYITLEFVTAQNPTEIAPEKPLAQSDENSISSGLHNPKLPVIPPDSQQSRYQPAYHPTRIAAASEPPIEAPERPFTDISNTPLPTAPAPMVPIAPAPTALEKPPAPQPVASTASSSLLAFLPEPAVIEPVHADIGVPEPVPIDLSSSADSKSPPAPVRIGSTSGWHSGSPGTIARPAVGSAEAPPELSNAPKTANPGPNSISTSKVDWGPYMLEVQKRIKAHWFPSKCDQSTRAIVDFKIARNGSPSHVRIQTSSRIPTFDQAAIKAVQNSAPFAELPAFAPDSVDIRFTFDFNVYGGKFSTPVKTPPPHPAKTAR